MKLSFGRGGVHPPEMKLTSGVAVKDMPLPMKVTISMAQSLGRPAQPIVTKGQHVNRYDKIGEQQGPISANVHTPISGTVKDIAPVAANDGHYVMSVVIEASEEDHQADLQMICDARPQHTLDEVATMEPTAIVDQIREAGIVGLGGATFPAAVKLAPPKDSKAEYLLVNGAECEPYLTCDEAIMCAMPDEIIAGILIMMRATGVEKAIVGIENNKPAAIERLKKAARSYPGISVVGLRTRYPQGGEKMLAKALTGREIAPGQLPITQGVIIQNVATALAVYHAVIWGIPLVERVLTISGATFEQRGNYRMVVGTPLKDVVDSLGGVPEQAVKIVAGGTMMGRSMADVEGFTTKGLSGLLFLSEEETDLEEPSPCVKCGKCVDSCPMGLQPYLIARLVELGRVEDALQHHLMDCMECGCCNYSCIARRRLVDWIRIGKIEARKLK